MGDVMTHLLPSKRILVFLYSNFIVYEIVKLNYSIDFLLIFSIFILWFFLKLDLWNTD